MSWVSPKILSLIHRSISASGYSVTAADSRRGRMSSGKHRKARNTESLGDREVYRRKKQSTDASYMLIAFLFTGFSQFVYW